MADLSEYDIDIGTLREMYDQWRAGATKSSLEREYLNAPQSHGKLFSTLVREHLGVETEKRSSQSDRIAELEREVERLSRVLRAHRIDPNEQGAAGARSDQTAPGEDRREGDL